MKKSDLVVALDMVIECFERLGIAYYIVGSVASSAYGIARATMDVDLVADIKINQVNPLVKALEADYYIDAGMIQDAIHRSSSFNLIHLETMIKIDVFLLKDQPYDSEAFARRCPDVLDEDSTRTFYLSSPEDIILNKLQWYQKGGEVSDQQWKDILGLLKVRGANLDWEYLKCWAAKLNLSDLLHRSLDDAGTTKST